MSAQAAYAALTLSVFAGFCLYTLVHCIRVLRNK